MTDSVRNIISLWESPEVLAGEIGANVEAVRKWRQRERIPSCWWGPIVDTSVARSAGVTVQRIANVHAAKRVAMVGA